MSLSLCGWRPSDQLLIVALVASYLTNLANQSSAAPLRESPRGSPTFHPRIFMRYSPFRQKLSPRADTFRCLTSPVPPLRRQRESRFPPVTVRLACVKRSASVQSGARIKLFLFNLCCRSYSSFSVLTEYFLPVCLTKRAP